MDDKEILDPEFPNYPAEIVKGDVIATAFKGLEERLKALFPENAFAHHILPPSAGAQYFKSLPAGSSNIFLGLGGMKIKNPQERYMGDLIFTIGALLQGNTANDLYLGTGQTGGIGAAGIIAAAGGALNGWHLEDVGTFFIKDCRIAPTQDWFDGGAVLVMIEGYFEDVALSDALFEALPDLELTHANIKEEMNG